MTTFQTLKELSQKRGEWLGTSKWILIDQNRIDDFARVTGDHQWIHTDPARTKAELGMPTIAHGFLTVSMIPLFMMDIFHINSVKRIINYGTNKIRFTDMVPVNSHIRGTGRLIKGAEQDGRMRATFEIVVEKQGSDKPVMIAEAIILLFE